MRNVLQDWSQAVPTLNYSVLWLGVNLPQASRCALRPEHTPTTQQRWEHSFAPGPADCQGTPLARLKTEHHSSPEVPPFFAGLSRRISQITTPTTDLANESESSGCLHRGQKKAGSKLETCSHCSLTCMHQGSRSWFKGTLVSCLSPVT